jgi:complement component 1 Q subcomponent-binding protein
MTIGSPHRYDKLECYFYALVLTISLRSNFFKGPMFRELAEDLQEAFVSYVQEECGVTSDVAAFISMYADYKEQVQYTHWLKAVHSLVK